MSTRSIPSSWRTIGSRYRLIGTRVPGEKTIFFPPRKVCPITHKKALEEVTLSGKGKIIACSVVHVPPERHELNHPYCIAIVEFEESKDQEIPIRVTTEIVGINSDQVKIGMDVKAVFRKYGADTADSVIVYGNKFSPII
ncbi:MAG: Zn-ribbon domain-containing OB-fold protein [Candidatus Hodarchaeales archaeon]|jgi:uncharacterized OB-fold protein